MLKNNIYIYINMDKNNIELKLINNNTDLNIINSIQLITFIMEEIELLKHLKGNEKKELVINILKEFINNNDNIFIKANNQNIIIAINNLLNTNIALDIIDTIVECADGAIQINNKIKSNCFCLTKK
jgi:Flp pilus assembly CpaF family ATPase